MAYPEHGGATTAVSLPPITSAMEDLQRQLEIINKSVEVLTMRLDPVLAPIQPGDPVNRKNELEAAVSPLASRIKVATENVRRLREHVDFVLSRVQI